MTANTRYALVLIGGFICQSAIVPFISIGAAKPDIILIIIATLGFIDGSVPGAVGGFIGGLLQDLLAASSVGLAALAKTLIGYVSGQVERNILGNSPFMPMVAIAGVSFVSQIIYMALAFIVGEPMEFITAIKYVVIPSTAYTAIVGFFVFPYISRVLSSERKEKVFK